MSLGIDVLYWKFLEGFVLVLTLGVLDWKDWSLFVFFYNTRLRYYLSFISFAVMMCE